LRGDRREEEREIENRKWENEKRDGLRVQGGMEDLVREKRKIGE